MSFGLIQLASFLVAIGVLIAAHEFGHFWVARRLGFKVLKFSIGFGRAIAGRTSKDGVEYVIGIIPLGGYVKLADERDAPVAEADASRAFNRRPVWQRILVLVAGAGANFVFAIVAFWILYMAGVPGLKPVLGEVKPASMAATAGLKAGDEIVAVDGREVATREAAVLAMLSDVVDDGRIELELKRGGGRAVAELIVPEDRRRALTEPGAWAEGFGFGFTRPHLPAVVGQVLPGGPAAAAGLEPGDEILAIDGRRVSEFMDFRNEVSSHPGATVSLELMRRGRPLTVAVTVRGEHDPNEPGKGLVLRWASR